MCNEDSKDEETIYSNRRPNIGVRVYIKIR